ncbi:HutD family protein [Limnohabitans sp. Rim11]|uniref:HutD/Ves family protein n=1 Tax=Limnohabitans sp. Rim11 TaxID=1100719 RepID=UPI001E62E860|nr:HutD family protein [Limnohabitans sp. Rim11]
MQLQDWQQIKLQDVPPSPWKNGGGTTQALVCWPNSTEWIFRMSVARIDSDGPFSEFKGVSRWFAVLQGEGVALQFPEKRVVLGAKDPVIQFSGNAPCHCCLTNGPTLDFNLMVQGISATMTRINRSNFIQNFRAGTTLAIFMVEEGGQCVLNEQSYALDNASLYWVTLKQDVQIALKDMHVLLIQMECSA